MKLTPLHVEILRGARKRLELSEDGFHSYICYAIQDEIADRYQAESKLRRNRLMFWRRNSIYEKWESVVRELQRAINNGLYGKATVGLWFDREAGKRGIEVYERHLNNHGLYKQIRLAWIDKMIETRVLA